MKCFEEINDNVIWKFLKIQLQKINRFDIIANIKNETLLTIGKYLIFVQSSILLDFSVNRGIVLFQT